MMLCVDKKMLHEPPPGHEPPPDQGPWRFQARGETPGNGVEYQPDGHAGPQTSHERHRQEVLLRVVRISDALNQRLAL